MWSIVLFSARYIVNVGLKEEGVEIRATSPQKDSTKRVSNKWKRTIFEFENRG